MKHGTRVVLAAVFGLGLIAAAPIRLESNRAIYKVGLDHALPGGLIAVHGRTVIEFRVTCDGYETRQRFIADMTGPDSNVSRSDFVIQAWEAKTGQAMRFDVTNMVDGQIAERYKGKASLSEDGSGEVSLSEPGAASFALPAGTLLPAIQTLDVIKAAEAGEHSLNRTVFQGGDKTDLYYATATIGAQAPDSVTDQEAAAAGEMLKGVPAWPVLMSYYPTAQDAVSPEYEIAARLYANGILGSMSMVYSRFTLRATLEKVEKLPTPECTDAKPAP